MDLNYIFLCLSLRSKQGQWCHTVSVADNNFLWFFCVVSVTSESNRNIIKISSRLTIINLIRTVCLEPEFFLEWHFWHSQNLHTSGCVQLRQEMFFFFLLPFSCSKFTQVSEVSWRKPFSSLQGSFSKHNRTERTQTLPRFNDPTDKQYLSSNNFNNQAKCFQPEQELLHAGTNKILEHGGFFLRKMAFLTPEQRKFRKKLSSESHVRLPLDLFQEKLTLTSA